VIARNPTPARKKRARRGPR